METTLTFYLDKEDKNIIRERAKKSRLGLSGYCRNILLNKMEELNL